MCNHIIHKGKEVIAYKVVMVGDFGVGKTSLVKRFVDDSFSEDYLSTIGVSISKKKLNDSTLMLWDIEGHTEFKPIFKQYLMGAKGFIIVADITRLNTIESIQRHIKLCHGVVKNAPICIALNKSDMPHTMQEKAINRLKELSEHVMQVYTTSAKEGDSVLEIFNTLDLGVTQAIKAK